MRGLKITLFQIALLAIISTPVWAATFTVTNNADSGPGSLRQAILDSDAAATDDEIEFDATFFSVPRTITLEGTSLFIDGNGSLTINGPGQNILTISADDLSRVFTIETAPAVTINDLTIRDGNSASDFLGGGGILIDSNTGEKTSVVSIININNLIITENQGGASQQGTGGGIACVDGPQTELNVENSVVSKNAATIGGGINIGLLNGSARSCNLSINNSIFTENLAASGAAVSNFINSGNGVLFDVSITNSSFFRNTSTGGGSVMRIDTRGHDFSIKNTTMAYNAGQKVILMSNSGNRPLSIENSTIAFNALTEAFVNGSAGAAITINVFQELNIRNTIVANNTNGDSNPDNADIDISVHPTATINSLGNNLFERVGPGSVISGDTASNITGVDPRLCTALRKNGGFTPSLTLAADSPAVDAGSETTFESVDQRSVNRPQNGDGTGDARSDIGAYERVFNEGGGGIIDMDGDCKTDLSIFRPDVGQWWYLRSFDDGGFATSFGESSDIPVPGDFTGDGETDIAFWRQGTGEWFILRSEDDGFFSFPFGAAGDIPAPGDYDGDGRVDAAVFRPSSATWFILRSSDGMTDFVGFGANGDLPVIADYDGDERDDIAIYRPSVSQWWINRSTDGLVVYAFGSTGDITVPGDYTGDEKADVAFWRPTTGEWFVLQSEDEGFFSFPFGATGDIPSPGDYDGDGRVDPAVFRPSTTNWFVNGSTDGVTISTFGAANDVPLASVYSVE